MAGPFKIQKLEARVYIEDARPSLNPFLIEPPIHVLGKHLTQAGNVIGSSAKHVKLRLQK